MAKPKKKKLETPRLPERMQRRNQLAHKFTDRKKEAQRKSARGRNHDDAG